jgi:integrase
MLLGVMTKLSKTRKNALAILGEYWLENVKGSPNIYIAWYDERTRQVRRRTTRTNVLQEAEVELARFVSVNSEMRQVDTDEVFLSQILIRYYEQHARHLPSASEAFRSCGLWLDHFEDVPISEITADAQDDFQSWMIEEKGWSVGYANRVISVGRAALRRSYKRGEIKTPPFIFDIDAKKYGRNRRRTRRLSIDEMARLIDAIPQRTPHVRMFVLLMLNTLSRPEAIFELHHSQIDFYDGLIFLNPDGREQTKKYRPVVPMTETIKPWLKEVPEGHHCVEWAGRAIKTIDPTWWRIRDAANLDNQVVIYTLRHTMATVLRRAGVPMDEIGGFLGHTQQDHRTTEIYAPFAPEYLQRARSAIDAYMEDLQKRCASPVLHPQDCALLSSCFQATEREEQRRRRAQRQKNKA